MEIEKTVPQKWEKGAFEKLCGFHFQVAVKARPGTDVCDFFTRSVKKTGAGG